MRYQGRVTRWNDERGFGFITPNGSRNLVFLHVSAFAERPRRPVMDELVNYELSDDQIGRPRAENVTFAADETGGAGDSSRTWARIAAVVLLLAAVIAVGAGAVNYFGWPAVLERFWPWPRF